MKSEIWSCYWVSKLTFYLQVQRKFMQEHLKKVGAEGQSNIICTCSLWIFFFDKWKTYLRSRVFLVRTFKLCPVDLILVNWFYAGCLYKSIYIEWLLPIPLADREVLKSMWYFTGKLWQTWGNFEGAKARMASWACQWASLVCFLY